MKKNLEKLSKEFIEFAEKNLSEVLLDYILKTWFIAQDKKRQKEFDTLRKEIMEKASKIKEGEGLND